MVAYRAGDASAFDQLFDRYAPMLMRTMTRGLFRPEDARDLVQQVFLQLHRHRKDYQVGRPLRPWIFTIALNLKREYFRHQKTRPESELSQHVAERLSVDAAEQARVEHRQRLQVALEALTEDQRDVILLHWLGGVPLPEVAEIVGASLSAVKVRAHRGYQSMREHLGSLETAEEQS